MENSLLAGEETFQILFFSSIDFSVASIIFSNLLFSRDIQDHISNSLNVESVSRILTERFHNSFLVMLLITFQ